MRPLICCGLTPRFPPASLPHGEHRAIVFPLREEGGLHLVSNHYRITHLLTDSGSAPPASVQRAVSSLGCPLKAVAASRRHPYPIRTILAHGPPGQNPHLRTQPPPGSRCQNPRPAMRPCQGGAASSLWPVPRDICSSVATVLAWPMYPLAWGCFSVPNPPHHDLVIWFASTPYVEVLTPPHPALCTCCPILDPRPGIDVGPAADLCTDSLRPSVARPVLSGPFTPLG